jgi:hypothetical protein
VEWNGAIGNLLSEGHQRLCANQLLLGTFADPLLCGTLADIKAEKANLANRHYWLYQIDPNYDCQDMARAFEVQGDDEIGDLLKLYKDCATTTSHTIVVRHLHPRR